MRIQKIKTSSAAIGSLFLLCVVTTHAWSESLLDYTPKLQIGSYIESPALEIRNAIGRYNWTLLSETDTTFNVELQHVNTKSQLIVNIHYDKEWVWLELVEHKSAECENDEQECAVPEHLLDRWMINLRRAMALNFHHQAIVNAQARVSKAAVNKQ